MMSKSLKQVLRKVHNMNFSYNQYKFENISTHNKQTELDRISLNVSQLSPNLTRILNN